MKTSDFYYNLPENLIAQTPIEPRDHSRLLVCDRKNNSLSHKHFYDIVNYLKPNDVLVINHTKVIPARLYGHREGKEEVVEILLLKRIDLSKYECLVKPGKKFKVGSKIVFSDNLSADVLEITETGERIINFKTNKGTLEEELDRIGEMPLPPYIKEKLKNKDRYQTVYAKEEGSSAAPTAGLHFTNELLDKIKNMGIIIEEVNLCVGLGTFRPVKVENVEEHVMHSEEYEVTEEVATRLNNYKKEGRRIIAIGTTTVRTLESASDENGILHAGKNTTSIFIYPPYKFKFVDALVTNFHLPESTLLMLVSALMGKKFMEEAYQEAIKEKYRFFSFGDAMLII